MALNDKTGAIPGIKLINEFRRWNECQYSGTFLSFPATLHAKNGMPFFYSNDSYTPGVFKSCARTEFFKTRSSRRSTGIVAL